MQLKPYFVLPVVENTFINVNKIVKMETLCDKSLIWSFEEIMNIL